VKKHEIFRPAGGGISCRVNDRVTRVIDRRYTVGSQPGVYQDNRPDSPAAAWDMLVLCPAGGDITRHMRHRLIHGSSGRFAVFAPVVVFVVQTPIAYLLLFDTRYAVSSTDADIAAGRAE